MTVGELKALLDGFDPTMEVCFMVAYGGTRYADTIVGVRSAAREASNHRLVTAGDQPSEQRQPIALMMPYHVVLDAPAEGAAAKGGAA